ncbi:rRNA maturation RNase YbeY, partial [Candidatus Peregrinibacteria bacterium]|nr:rRNA maturation RNase YbeY [Candidatus Peregrinibacteria bacterium]
MITVRFINAREWKIDTKTFQPLIARLKKAVSVQDGILNVVFVNDAYIRALNRTYRKKDEATDVLSFSYNKTFKGHGDLLGEVYISMNTAKRQAKKHKHTILKELNKLFVHGFLHVHGFNHEELNDFKKMSAIEKEILN